MWTLSFLLSHSLTHSVFLMAVFLYSFPSFVEICDALNHSLQDGLLIQRLASKFEFKVCYESRIITLMHSLAIQYPEHQSQLDSIKLFEALKKCAGTIRCDV